LDQANLGLPEVYFQDPVLWRDVLRAYKNLIVGTALAIRDTRQTRVSTRQISKEADELIAFEITIAEASSSFQGVVKHITEVSGMVL
jgi:hypothetical protein